MSVQQQFDSSSELVRQVAYSLHASAQPSRTKEPQMQVINTQLSRTWALDKNAVWLITFKEQRSTPWGN